MKAQDMIDAVVEGAPARVLIEESSEPLLRSIRKALKKAGARKIKIGVKPGRLQWAGDYGQGETALESLGWKKTGEKMTSASTTISYTKDGVNAKVFDNPDKGIGIMVLK